MRNRWKILIMATLLLFTDIGYQVSAQSNQELTIIKGYSQGQEEDLVDYISNSSFYIFKLGDKELSKKEKKEIQKNVEKKTIQEMIKEYSDYYETGKTDSRGRVKINLDGGYSYLIVEDISYQNAITIKGKKYKSAPQVVNLFEEENQEIILKPVEIKKDKPQTGPTGPQKPSAIDQEAPKTGDKPIWIWSAILLLSLISTLSLRNKKEVKI